MAVLCSKQHFYARRLISREVICAIIGKLTKFEGNTRTSLKLFTGLETMQWFLTWRCSTSSVNVPDCPSLMMDPRFFFFQSILMTKIVLLQKKKIWDIKNLPIYMFGDLFVFWWPWLLSCLQLHFYRKWVFSMRIRITVRKEQFPVQWGLIHRLGFHCVYILLLPLLVPWSHHLPSWCHHLCTITNKKLTS